MAIIKYHTEFCLLSTYFKGHLVCKVIIIYLYENKYLKKNFEFHLECIPIFQKFFFELELERARINFENQKSWMETQYFFRPKIRYRFPLKKKK